IIRLDDASTPAAHLEIDLESIFVAPPAPVVGSSKGRSIKRVLKRFDPAQRDAANSKLGEAGEKLVIRVERHRLTTAGRGDLAEKVAWVCRDIGDGLGYDIGSFTDDGSPIFVEVKATKGPIGTP